MANDPTETQSAPNISTEHQKDGDARHPSDRLDKDQHDGDRATTDGNGQQNVEDRPNVGSVTPEDYPVADRAR